ncbi:hypothetical protein TNCV_4525571 [Trichonephila clavipes]|nr:hypothetical protein TNCV_4525571 [Trichonephila clavipes]
MGSQFTSIRGWLHLSSKHVPEVLYWIHRLRSHTSSRSLFSLPKVGKNPIGNCLGWVSGNRLNGRQLLRPPSVCRLRMVSLDTTGCVKDARISKAKRRKRVTRDMSTLKNSMLELAAKFDDNYNTGLIKSFMFGLNKTEIKTMTDILSRYKFRDSHGMHDSRP